MSELAMFKYSGQLVRTVMHDGEPVFIGKDACDVLGIVKYRDALGQLDADERVSVTVDTLGGPQTMTAVTEAGIYSLALISRSPDAKAFIRWLTHEVVPSIRKTGSYAVEQSPEIQIANALILASSMIAAKDAQIVALTPRADAWDELASASGDFEVADAAKILARAGVETGQARLFKQLADLSWIHRGSQGKWKAYQSAVDAGYLAEKPMTHYHPKSGELVLDPPQVRVTVRGLERLRVRLGTLQLVS